MCRNRIKAFRLGSGYALNYLSILDSKQLIVFHIPNSFDNCKRDCEICEVFTNEKKVVTKEWISIK